MVIPSMANASLNFCACLIHECHFRVAGSNFHQQRKQGVCHTSSSVCWCTRSNQKLHNVHISLLFLFRVRTGYMSSSAWVDNYNKGTASCFTALLPQDSLQIFAGALSWQWRSQNRTGPKLVFSGDGKIWQWWQFFGLCKTSWILKFLFSFHIIFNMPSL